MFQCKYIIIVKFQSNLKYPNIPSVTGVKYGLKYIPRARQYIHPERKHTTASFKRGVSVVKRPAISRTSVRDIIKKPVTYIRKAAQAERPVKRIPPRKTEESTAKSTKGTKHTYLQVFLSVDVGIVD